MLRKAVPKVEVDECRGQLFYWLIEIVPEGEVSEGGREDAVRAVEAFAECEVGEVVWKRGDGVVEVIA
jgi:hypothetical protein